METFAEVREHALELYDVRIDEPFLIGFEYAMGDNGRQQGMYFTEIKGNDDRRYLRIETLVAPLEDLAAEKCLRINYVQRVGYLAVGDMDGKPWIKLCENMPYSVLSAQELDHITACLAMLADHLEEWLESGTDVA